MGCLGTECLQLRLRTRAVLDQIFSMGVIGTPSTFLCMAFLSSVMVVELSFHMRLIAPQDAMVPSFTTVLLLRELGPVVTAMLASSRIGGAIAAELSTLNTTGQMDALLLSGVDPIRYWVVPRVLGCLISSIALGVLAVGGAIVVTAFSTASYLGLTPPLFLAHLFLFTETTDFYCAIFKSVIFGLLIPLVASYQGMYAPRGSLGVGIAATQSVVHNSVAIILIDFLVSSFWYAI